MKGALEEVQQWFDDLPAGLSEEQQKIYQMMQRVRQALSAPIDVGVEKLIESFFVETEKEEHKYGRHTYVQKFAYYLAAQGHLKQGWEPIETAPKDGQFIIAYDLKWSAFPEKMYWSRHIGGWCIQWAVEERPEPTHWQPLPQPPENSHE